MKIDFDIIFGIIVVVVFLFGGIVLFTDMYDRFDAGKDRLELCHSLGYDGYVDIGGFGRTEYVCYVDIGGFREYSEALA